MPALVNYRGEFSEALLMMGLLFFFLDCFFDMLVLWFKDCGFLDFFDCCLMLPCWIMKMMKIFYSCE